MADRPNALAAWQHISARLCAAHPGRIVIGLDYDGTLTPITDRPDQARLAEATRTLLRRLAERFPTAVISGRSLADVRDLVGVESLYYSGNHGYELQRPGRAPELHPSADGFLADLTGVAEQLAQPLAALPGAWLEDKRYTLTVHYRGLAQQDVPRLAAELERVLAGRDGLALHDGKKVFEIRPRLDWDKGKAIGWLLQALHLPPAATAVLYVGDDVTDEAAFAAVSEHGVGIRVGQNDTPSAARYALSDSEQVRELLERLVAL